MKIRRLDVRKRRDVRRFIDFPFQLYAGDDHWSPPLRSGVRRTLNRKSILFMPIRTPLSSWPKTAAGCGPGWPFSTIPVITGIRPECRFLHLFRRGRRRRGGPGRPGRGCRLGAERGRTSLLGPKGFVRSDAPGLLVEGFEYEAALAMPYNFDYYPRLLETAGFVKEVDYLSGYLTKGYELPNAWSGWWESSRNAMGFQARALRSKARAPPVDSGPAEDQQRGLHPGLGILSHRPRPKPGWSPASC